MPYIARTLAVLTLALPTLLVLTPSSSKQGQATALPNEIKAILENNCTKCHTIADRLRFVRPKDPAGSELYQVLITEDQGKRMPYNGDPLSKENIEAVKKWIEEGAPGAVIPQPTSLITDDDVIRSIAIDLDKPERRDDSKFFRYIVLNHLHNAGATEQELAFWRGGISKLINSLSWGGTIQKPEPVDENGLILRVDLRHYDWHQDNGYKWRRLASFYPYGIKYRSNLAATVYQATGEAIPFIRGDWFVATASLPPLYDDLLALPDTADELETKLKVPRLQNLKDGIAIRGGMATGFSKIAQKNRVVERHPATHQYYWRSYDFRKDSGEQNIFTHPLDFKEDGGEIIFGLPNGLQGYLLVDGEGKRLKEGKAPVDIVFNREGQNAILLKSVEIFNGLSCMSCHSQGMIGFRDEVRKSQQTPPKDRKVVERIYVEQKRMDAELDGDRERFLKATEKTGAEISKLEPIVALAFQYHGELSLQKVASEVGLTTETFAKELQKLDLPQREKQVLNPLLAEGGTISRTQWEPIFGEVVRQLDIGEFIPPKPIVLGGGANKLSRVK